MPRDKSVGDEVFSGTVNAHGLLHIRVTEAGDDSTLARLIHLVEEARDHRTAPVVRVADRYARYFLPAILLAAGAVYMLSSGSETAERVRRAVTVPDRGLSLRTDPGHASHHGGGNRRVGSARASGSWRPGGATGIGDRHGRV